MRALLFLLILAAGTCSAAMPWEYTPAAMNYRPYPVGPEAMTDTLKVPEGYRLFSLQHYGRHGSRLHTDHSGHDKIAALLSGNERTAMGDSLLADIMARREAMEHRQGDLTPLGAAQHRGIAHRMVVRAPQLFRKETRLNAVSSYIVRCVLSMANATGQIRNDVPGIEVRLDASKADVGKLRNERGDAEPVIGGPYAMVLRDYRNANSSGTEWISRLLKPGYEPLAMQSADSLADCLHDIMANATSEGLLMRERKLFTPAEIEAIHRRLNAEWLMYAGNYRPYSGKRMAFAAELLRDIIKKTDVAAADTLPHVDLRFGHESMLMPLLALMNINGYGKGYNSPEEAEGEWDAGFAIPMAANLQLYFARPIVGESPILVKAFLNEEPAELPGSSVTDGWTEWLSLKQYYLLP